MALSPKERKIRYKLRHPERFKLQQSIQNRKWRENNKELKVEIDKNYRETHKEELKVKKAEYYQENKETIKEKKRIYYELNRDRYLSKAKVYRTDNKESVQAKTKEWCKNNPERLRLLSAKKEAIRRARKRGNLVKPYNRLDIYDRDGGVCYLCNHSIDINIVHPNPFSFSIDHVVPISKGGGDTPDNVRSAHLRCNMVKHDSVIDVINNKYNINSMNNMKVRIAS